MENTNKTSSKNLSNFLEQQKKMDALAQDVLILSRNTLLVNLRFLDISLSQFRYVPAKTTIATDGAHFFYDPHYILLTYKKEKEHIVRDYLHLVMHCIFRHPFVSLSIDTEYWNLACDIAVEATICDLALKSATTSLEQQKRAIITGLQQQVRHMNAEKLYHYLLNANLSEKDFVTWEKLFRSDDHEIWYLSDDARASSLGLTISNHTNDNSFSSYYTVAQSKEELEEQWKSISERMQLDLETFSKLQGDKAGNLVQNLLAINREKYDYTAFLKKFAVRGEVMKVNEDEFDYIFYTYGLKLYKKMPLIEPLEYKDVKRIREFVIAIDTSGSVAGELLQTFLQKTYHILKSTESFFSKINLHIIQCDTTIQEDVKITCQEDFDTYLKDLKLKGLGGTDFRPVFSYVNQLIQEKEFQNLKGLIYFTDGYGTFPQKKPDYDTAFIFIDDAYNNFDVPPWAIKLILQKDEL